MWGTGNTGCHSDGDFITPDDFQDNKVLSSDSDPPRQLTGMWLPFSTLMVTNILTPMTGCGERTDLLHLLDLHVGEWISTGTGMSLGLVWGWCPAILAQKPIK